MGRSKVCVEVFLMRSLVGLMNQLHQDIGILKLENSEEGVKSKTLNKNEQQENERRI